MVEKEKPVIHEDENINKISLKEFSFSPEVLNELYDAITQTKEIIGTYYDSSSRFPSSMRDEIGGLMIESDLLLLAFNELYVTASEMIEKLKKKKLLRQRVAVSRKENEKFLQQLEFLKVRVKKLIRDTEDYVRKVKDYHRIQPLPL
ncbi:MAG: hypothetical protein QXO69_02885 [archaeon]